MDVIYKYRSYFIMLILWTAIGPLTTSYAVPAIIVISMLVLKAKYRYTELLAGLWYVLTLSDNRLDYYSGFIISKYIYLLLLVAFMMLELKRFFPFNNLITIFIPFFLIALYCTTRSPVILNSVAKTISYIILLVTVPNYLIRSYRDNGPEVFKLLIYTGVLVLLSGLILRLIFPLDYSFEMRLRGMLGNPNGLGLFCTFLFLLFSLTANFYPELFHRQEKIVIYFLIFISLILSGSRNALLAVFIYMLFASITKLSSVFSVIIMLGILAGYAYLELNIVTIVKSLGLESYFRVETLATAAGRYVAWAFAWTYIKQNLYIGNGFNYTEYLFNLNQLLLNALGHQGNAHNSYLTFWLDTGLVGLVAYFWAFLSKFIGAIKKNRLALPVMYAVLVSSVFESYLTASENPYTIIVVVLLTMLSSDEFHIKKTEAVIPVQ